MSQVIKRITPLAFFLTLTFGVHGAPKKAPLLRPVSNINYPAFQELSGEAYAYRKDRRVPLETFLSMSQDKNTIILDTRSASAYRRRHLKGAVHLNFSDFTTEKLAKVIPSKTTRILIYCNNNFEDDPINFQAKSAPLALNIPTFINLYGYGYKNIYELKDLISIKDRAVRFEGTDKSLQQAES